MLDWFRNFFRTKFEYEEMIGKLVQRIYEWEAYGKSADETIKLYEAEFLKLGTRLSEELDSKISGLRAANEEIRDQIREQGEEILRRAPKPDRLN
ncbi:hypothetical protein HFO51_06560 [Rhizobium leguminosarum]|uniref:hypothetical protein n=1 Tax=Rhizobium leguminosarum TaxID=384 RepID=UPI001C97E94A|nr:hypothetical protein [Rhizobium leguminosarum]MBY5594130.1 hypothetical protein [Rhizobium leguminosarum]